MRVLFLLGPCISIFAAPVPVSPAKEVSPYLFEARLGDEEADLTLLGSWKASLSGALGFVITPQGELQFPSPFPGLEAAQAFRQTPDLTFSIWLKQHYFLEGSVKGDFTEEEYRYFDQNYLVLGYKGNEEEFLRSIFIGTRDIGIAPYPFLEIPEPGSSSLGASALMGAGLSTHQVLLRYDNNEPDSVTYLGKNLVEESKIGIEAYIRGRFFRLPDAGVETLEVYLEDPDGAYTDAAGHRYRLATVDDGLQDSVQGVVFLGKAAKGSVLVYYEKGGLPVGDPVLGAAALTEDTIGPPYYIDLSSKKNFNWSVSHLGQSMIDRRVAVNGRACLRLWKPGEFSPFEILGSYSLAGKPPEDLSRLQVKIVDKADPSVEVSPKPDVRFRLIPGEDYFTACRSDDLRGDLGNLYPFLDAGLDPDNLLYGPCADPTDGYVQNLLLVSLLTPVEEYKLGSDLVPGSVRILRNGVEETRFEVDYEQGLVKFLTDIAPDDRLVISFRRRLSLAGNGDFLFAWGNRIPLGAQTLELAAGLRWNALPGNFSEKAYSRTGGALASAGLKGEAGPLRYSVSAAGAFTNPDTTGILRLLSMEGRGLEAALSEDTAYPAAAPAGTVDGYTLTQDNRGELFYKDYRSYGLAGTSRLMPYDNRDWSPPPEQVFLYQAGSKPGPYKAAGSAEGRDEGESLVLDFHLEANEWVGTQLPVLADEGLADLSNMESVSVSYRAIGVSGSFKVYVQIGETDEDLDGDDTLDQEASESSAGFRFDDANAGTMYVGSGPKNQGNNRLDSEDVDGNGILDGEDSGYLTTFPTGGQAVSGDGDWTSVRHTFSETEKRALRRTRTVRLLVLSSGASDGRLLIDRIAFEGSRFHTTGAEAREIEEWAAAYPPAKELVEAFQEVQDTFHPNEEVQKVLEVEWNGDWELSGYTQTGSEGIDYRSLVYYYRLPAISGGAEMRFALLDAADKGIHWTLPVSGPVADWTKIEVSLDDPAVEVDDGHGSLVLFTASLSGTASGTLYLDEVHLADPRSSLGAAAEAELELALPGALLVLGGHPVVHDLTLRQKAWAATEGFSSLYGAPASISSLASRTEVSVGLSLVDLDTDVLLLCSGPQLSLSGGHKIAFPNVPFPVSFTDAFSLRDGTSRSDLSRENRLTASAGRFAALELAASASSREELLTQAWSADLGLRPWVLNLAHRLELSAVRDEYLVSGDDYFSDWIEAYRLLLPWTGGKEVERNGKGELEWAVNTRPLGVRIAGTFGAQSFDFLQEGAGRKLKSTLELELSLPLSWTREEVTLFSLTPGYRRSLELLEGRAEAGDLLHDLSDGWRQMAGQSYWFVGIPGEELFSRAAEEAFQSLSGGLEEATYVPELFVSINRFSSARLIDLFLPSLLEASLRKELAKAGARYDFRNKYQLSLQSRAMNLFGRLGAYPLFPFYRSDEYSTAVDLTLGMERTAAADLGLTSAELRLVSFLSFHGDGEEALTLENRFGYTIDEETGWSDTVSALFGWQRRPAQGVRLPLLAPQAGRSAYWSHEESLELALTAEDQGAVPSLNLVLEHETSLLLPERGYLKGMIGLGMAAEQAAGEGTYWRAGLRGTLEAKIEF